MFTVVLPTVLALTCAQLPENLAGPALAKINGYRKAAGLPLVELDAKLSKACLLHARYLARNADLLKERGFSPHLEDPERPGYTREGDRAAHQSEVYYSFGRRNPLLAIDSYMGSLFHRLPLIRPDLKRIGVAIVRFEGNRHWVVVDTKSGLEGGPKAFAEPVLYPGDEQKFVPLAFAENEIPNPLPPEGRRRSPGFPITIMFPEKKEVTDAAGVLKTRAGREVPCWLSSPAYPAHRTANQHNTICLIPKDRLRPGTTYTVTVTGEVDGKEWSRSWSFTTAGR